MPTTAVAVQDNTTSRPVLTSSSPTRGRKINRCTVSQPAVAGGDQDETQRDQAQHGHGERAITSGGDRSAPDADRRSGRRQRRRPGRRRRRPDRAVPCVSVRADRPASSESVTSGPFRLAGSMVGGCNSLERLQRRVRRDVTADRVLEHGVGDDLLALPCW